MTETIARIWTGPPVLEPFLVPIDDLEPFPNNPRRGDVKAVAGSLDRFGQAKLSVSVDGKRIVAGHHVVKAARELGWTHIAVLPVEFANEDEARAFLLADNRSSDLGDYDRALLVEHLEALAEIDALVGTGYTTDDLDAYLAELRKQSEESVLPPEEGAPPVDKGDLREVVLLYSAEQRDQLELWLKMVAKEKGTDGLSETIYAAANIAALAVHHGEVAPDDE